jgi:DNA-binding MarR family transcriptional regulator
MSNDSSEKYLIADALHSAAIRLLRLVRVEDARSGIGPAQLSALSVLVFGGTKALNELAAMEQVRPPTMSRIVESLVKQGLAKRVTDEHDRRAIQITPTAKGKKLLMEGRSRRVRALTQRIERLNKEEAEILRKAAHIMARL